MFYYCYYTQSFVCLFVYISVCLFVYILTSVPIPTLCKNAQQTKAQTTICNLNCSWMTTTRRTENHITDILQVQLPGPN